MLADFVSIAPTFRRWRHSMAVVLAAAGGLATLGGPLPAIVDDELRIVRDRMRQRPASGEIQVIEIDGRSLQAIGTWPWPRRMHAALVDRLADGGARTIAFDVDFSALSDPVEDAQFAQSLERAGGGVMLPTLRQAAGAGHSNFIENIPAKPFRDKAFMAAVNVIPDRDGSIRSMPFGIVTQGTPRPSLPALLAERTGAVGTAFAIDYSIDPTSIPRISAIDLIEGRIARDRIAGKRFVIGATAVELGDRYAVPGWGVVPGVVVQALAAETILDRPVPRSLSPGWLLALTLGALALSLRIGHKSLKILALSALLSIVLLLPLLTESLFALTLGSAASLIALLVGFAGAAAGFAGARYLQRALTDAVTGLPNAAALESAIGRGEEIVVARIDRFAQIASGLGPDAMALLVTRIAERVSFGQAGRTVYRIDDGSLAWIEPSHDVHSLDDRLDGLATLMRAPVECGRLVDVSLTFGVSSVAGSRRQAIANASLAAVRAAEHGARWERYCDADGAEIDWHISLLGELDAALAGGQIWNAYQPKLDLATGRILGVETLVRWSHPSRGPIGPDSFIPLIEAAGRARELTLHVLEQAMDDALVWARTGQDIGVAVNVSATLLADHEFIETVGQLVQSHRLAAEKVTIEVTESAAMDSPDRAIAALESWRSHGVEVSIDDYGTGQSSLGYLQKLPATELKIDRSFVQTIVTDRRNAIMVRSTIALAHELGMKIVAEGIEDAACLSMLTEIGCDTAQGYFIAKPMNAAALTQFLDQRTRAVA